MTVCQTCVWENMMVPLTERKHLEQEQFEGERLELSFLNMLSFK